MFSNQEETIRRVESLVRETGYNYARLLSARNEFVEIRLQKTDLEEALSRAFDLYFLAKELLHHVDPDNAESFIQSTYGYKANG